MKGIFKETKKGYAQQTFSCDILIFQTLQENPIFENLERSFSSHLITPYFEVFFERYLYHHMNIENQGFNVISNPFQQLVEYLSKKLYFFIVLEITNNKSASEVILLILFKLQW